MNKHAHPQTQQSISSSRVEEGYCTPLYGPAQEQTHSSPCLSMARIHFPQLPQLQGRLGNAVSVLSIHVSRIAISMQKETMDIGAEESREEEKLLEGEEGTERETG